MADEKWGIHLIPGVQVQDRAFFFLLSPTVIVSEQLPLCPEHWKPTTRTIGGAILEDWFGGWIACPARILEYWEQTRSTAWSPGLRTGTSRCYAPRTVANTRRSSRKPVLNPLGCKKIGSPVAVSSLPISTESSHFHQQTPIPMVASPRRTHSQIPNPTASKMWRHNLVFSYKISQLIVL